MADVAEHRLLNASFDDSRSVLISGVDELSGNDRSADDFCRIDDFLDSRDTECDIHRGYTGEVECLQGHLGTRFPYRLGSYSADGGA